VGLPSPAQEFEWAVERAVEKAVLQHPQTKQLSREIEERMRSAAKAAPKKKGGKR